ncbi:MAG: chorismate synthase [Ruminococcus sp.]|nr:chorismate synthase [Ruminococcus sp.]
MSSVWNNRISISVFGEANGFAIGVTIDNLPAGEYIDSERIISFMRRRLPLSANLSDSAQKIKAPLPRMVSGIRNDRTTGAPLCALIQNSSCPEKENNNVSKSALAGHADYTGAVRYRGYSDVRHFDNFSELFTAPLCFAGAVCAQILERRGIYVGAHISAIHNIKDNPFDPVNIKRDGILSIRQKDFPVINDRKGWIMLDDMKKANEYGEILGGIVECAAVNIPAGVGSPMFDGLDNSIAQLVFGIPAVRGVEFGAGFVAAQMTGSQAEDNFISDEYGHEVTKTNRHGGILGGISSGMPVTINVAFKPQSYRYCTPSQDNAAYYCPCVVPTAVPCVEAAVNIAVLSHMIDYPNFC